MKNLLRAVLVLLLSVPLMGAKRPPETGSPETVMPPCFIPKKADSQGWRTVHLHGVPPSFKIPASFTVDSTIWRIDSRGTQWQDGKRFFNVEEGVWDGGERSLGLGSPACIGYSSCVDTLAGFPFRIATTYNTGSEAYRVYAVPLVKPTTIMGYTEMLEGSSPDSADQRLFLAIFRTLARDSASSESR